jgi:hypothetical protein
MDFAMSVMFKRNMPKDMSTKFFILINLRNAYNFPEAKQRGKNQTCEDLILLKNSFYG